MDVVVTPRDLLPGQARTLPAAYHVDRRYFDREMEALFARMWLAAGRTEQVDAPGRFFVREVLGERIIITASSGGVRATTASASIAPGSIRP